MVRNRRERGEGQFGCLIGIILLLVAGVLAYKLIPVKVKAADLRDTIDREAKSGHDEKEITQAVLRKADELQLPLTAENIKIKRSSSYITVDVEHEVPIDLPGYNFNWKFHHHVENPRF